MTSRRFPIPTRHTVARHEWVPPRRRPTPLRDPVALVALFYLLLSAGAAAAAPLISPYDPLEITAGDRFLPPGAQHPAGTDLFGRDLATRIIYGGRLSLGIGTAAVLISSLPGTLLGLVAGYYGRSVDRLISWWVDVMLAFPSVLLALTIVAALGTGPLNVVLAVGIAGIPNYTRLVRGQVLSARRQPYVRAAVVVGATPARIVLRHILPNVVPVAIIFSAQVIGGVILIESALSFLGLGVQPPTATWGNMLNKAQSYFTLAPHLVVWPGLLISLTVLCLYVIGDGLRDALDPTMRGKR